MTRGSARGRAQARSIHLGGTLARLPALARLELYLAEGAEASPTHATEPGAMPRTPDGAWGSATAFAQMAIQEFKGEFGS